MTETSDGPARDSSIPSVLAEYPIVLRLPVLWGDEDSFQHVNNTVMIRWIESARILYMDQPEITQPLKESGLGPILASVHCNYRRQVKYPDTILTAARVPRLGQSSLTMEHAMYSEGQGEIVADGEATIVIFNYQTQRSQPIPDSVRQFIERLEGGQSGT